MDASASPKVDTVKDVNAFYFKIENTNFPRPSKETSTIIKYTKLPEFDYEAKGVWPKNNYTLQPRLRRLISLEEPRPYTSRSLKMAKPISHPTVPINNRRIVTISEDEEYDLHPKFSNRPKKSSTVISRAVETELKRNPSKTNRNLPRHTTPTKCPKECRSKTNNSSDNKDTVSTSRITNKNRLIEQASLDNIRSRPTVERDTTKKSKSASFSKPRLSKNFVQPSESEQELSHLKAKLNPNLNNVSSKKFLRSRENISTPAQKRNSFLLEMQKKRTPSVIHVPLEEKGQRRKLSTITNEAANPTIMVYAKSDGSMDTEIVLHQDGVTSTEPQPVSVDQMTDMEGYEPEITYKCIKSTDVQADLIRDTFDKLEIPNVSLKKHKIDFKDDLFDLHSRSLPNLQIPPLKIKDNREEESILDSHYSKSTSYIISRSTLTYKTQQKINFHVVENHDQAYSNQLSSQLKYPLSVVSVFKEELSAKECDKKTLENKSSKKYKNCVNEIKALNCSYVPNSTKLMKPSDIISTIRVNNSLLQSVLVCEQFQRELNFIDSFFESLQYLESCSLSDKCYKDEKIEELVNKAAILDPELDYKSPEYDKFFSKLENGANSDSETMVSKNLFLLNILIRDEQRRAKNLLCVLKRREDALKHFTKSQILYLENKKRQDNTDISALKKKQRGALLKLQHECGEMQRMRKALLALSEKRKVALMKTKKDLELKLRNNVNVEQIIIGKKKLKKTNTSVDRSSLPLKCFDLSSSGCEDSTSSRGTSEDIVIRTAPATTEPITSVEKSIQTTDSILGSNLAECATNTADEHYVVVDGGYLNILFHNLTLPQIFSGGKQYEVNEEALKDIVDSTNRRHADNWNDVVEKLMTQPKKDDEDNSSTPSTARSLVEEFEQYYRTLEEENVSELRSPNTSRVYKTIDTMVQTSFCKTKPCVSKCVETMTSKEVKFVETMTTEEVECLETMTAEEVECIKVTVDESSEYEMYDKAPISPPRIAGPLPVPAGAAHDPEPTPPVDDLCPSPKSSDSSCSGSSASSQPPCDVLSSSLEPSHAEAEELRRQQLAIEREIKELEQQQCQLLVVREIPDKPPPPYTPPVETRPPQKPRPFRPDDAAQERLRCMVTDPAAAYDPADAFDVLIHDFSQEIVHKHTVEKSDKPWDSCNLLAQKPAADADKLYKTASSELTEILTPATPSLVSGVSSRRSDHIDDILFAEWRRAEPEWTSLHTDEALVKNQVFETIFQRILTETVDEYKRTILTPPTEKILLL